MPGDCCDLHASVLEQIEHTIATLYRERNLIERFFSKLKHFRRVATRYDKLASNFLAMIQLASIRLWLRAYESTFQIGREGSGSIGRRRNGGRRVRCALVGTPADAGMR